MKKILSFVLAAAVCASYVLGSTCTAEAFDVELYDNTIEISTEEVNIDIIGTDPSGTYNLSKTVSGQIRDGKVVVFDTYSQFDEKKLGKSAGMVPVFYTESDGGGTRITYGTDVSPYLHQYSQEIHMTVYVKWIPSSEYFSKKSSSKVKIKKIKTNCPYNHNHAYDLNREVTMLSVDWQACSDLVTDYIIQIKYPGKSKYKTLGESGESTNDDLDTPFRIFDTAEYIPTCIKGFNFKTGYYSYKFCKGKYSAKPITGTYTIKITPVYYGVKGPTITKKYKLK